MNNVMEFPETVEEFMEEYKIVDKEEVYTNGTELVPIFRMKQWFEAHEAIPVEWIRKWASINYIEGEYSVAVDMIEDWEKENE